MKNKTFAKIVNTINYTATINGYPKSIHNTNELLGNVNGVYGIKTGFTNGANRCLVSCCKRNNLDIICVVLGADTKSFRTRDSIQLIEYIFNNFEPVNIEEIAKQEFLKWKEKNSRYFIIEKGIKNELNIDLTTNNINTIPINKNDIAKLKTSINCNIYLIAPIKSKTIIGSIDCKIDEKTINSYNIISTENIEKKNLINYINLFFKQYKNSNII